MYKITFNTALRAKKKSSNLDMTEGNCVKHILTFSIPLLFGNIFQQMYNMVDAIIVGKLLGTNALAAVGSTGPMHFLVFGFVSGLTSGFAVIAAQKFGAKDYAGLKRSTAMNVKLNLLSTIIFTTIALFLAKGILTLINTPKEIFNDAYDYIMIIYGGIWALVLYNTASCLLRAIGDSRSPLYFLIISSIMNIILDLVFIIKFNLGIKGAAWATVISQAFSGIISVVYIIKKYKILHPSKKDFDKDIWFAKQHLAIGLPMALQFSITAIGCMILQGALNVFGAIKIAGYTAAQKVEMLVTVSAGTFGVTMANYTGQNLGANNIQRIKQGTLAGAILCCVFATVGMLVALIFPNQLSMLFIDMNSEISSQCLLSAKTYLYYTAPFYPMLFLIFIYRNVLQSMGHSFMPLMAGFFELIARLIVSIVAPPFLGFAGVCLANAIAWPAAAIPLIITYYRKIKKY